MSLKNVELQVALPRTQEVGRIQEQQQHRQMHEHQYGIDARNQQDRQMQQRTTNISETDKGQIKDKQEKEKKRNRRAAGEHKQAAEGKAQGDKGSIPDPIRGRHIDISL
ncbi:hypothetical protein G3578_02465 [Brevibacillus sp. SYP-B805]|uniref:hypothetical protein n=1 Tax=Brevibacillus sp. SYP-B805 TaxID=1578199 RepID=UPI0013EDAC97|nr:hypothetical protein [Brevibacillus sp. SYP-B805]NGQ94035.1 hypothetical protein [Brevibacillus sp. SYP-B805]